MKHLLFTFLTFLSINIYAQDVAILKYNGGGDWYANPTAIPNLIDFGNTNITTNIAKNPQTVSVNSMVIFYFLMTMPIILEII